MALTLTPAQQDYMEIIYRLEQANGRGSVRISEIAAELGTRLPTVSRAVRKLTDMGLLEHSLRRAVDLTPVGEKLATEILHRHEDLVQFFTTILGLRGDEAQVNACQLEHGLTNRAAQRLHEFLEFVEELDSKQQELFSRFVKQASRGTQDFNTLSANKTTGWRT